MGEYGELCVRGYGVMLGYWEDEEKTKSAIDAGGWLHTGLANTNEAHALQKTKMIPNSQYMHYYYKIILYTSHTTLKYCWQFRKNVGIDTKIFYRCSFSFAALKYHYAIENVYC